jgi:hypothetical protein
VYFLIYCVKSRSYSTSKTRKLHEKKRRKNGIFFCHYTLLSKNTYIFKTKQDLYKRYSEMKSTINSALERCIFSQYLKSGFFHLSPTLISQQPVKICQIFGQLLKFSFTILSTVFPHSPPFFGISTPSALKMTSKLANI